MKTNMLDGIIHLSEEEREEPVLVIFLLFSISSLENLRLDLWQYLKAATTRLGWPMLPQPGDAPFLQKMLERLMEACWLLLREKEARDGQVTLPSFAPASEEWWQDQRQVQGEREQLQAAHGGRIRLLRLREMENPYLVMKVFFNAMPLSGWKALLDDWTEYALRRASLFEETENHNLLVHYELLEKLLEMAYCMSASLEGKEQVILTGVHHEESATA
ncbi:hypothetical protein [Rufibacter sp. LB8]|uniref:hypothetical protein n=2 Tax=Rufibacter sp. LB8 TaxID=2777781 RepID=UPI00178C3971|nr:hypothetical protein [Rufibacter sp. LB8]